VALHGGGEAIDPNVFIEGLGQKANRPIVERLSADILVGNGCDER